jgi:hypothetical protein
MLETIFSKLGQCQIGVFVILIASMKMHFTRFGSKGRKNQLIIHACRLKFVILTSVRIGIGLQYVFETCCNYICLYNLH